MKTKELLLLVVALLCFATQGFSQKMKVILEPKEIYLKSGPNHFPPGAIKVKQYYVDKTEIANIHWLEFLHYRKKEVDSVAYQQLLPDSLNTWYTLPDYYFAPLVLITYEQAVEYCKWRSEIVSRNFNKKVTYRLPSPEEWKEIAQEVINTDSVAVQKELAKTGKFTRKAPDDLVYNRVRNLSKYRIYHLFSNVSEMTSEKYIAVGSNNKQLTSIDLNIRKKVTYDSPSAYLGFRCIAEVEE
jgi:formylglycine-generating enzyme required for sulfatase activity